MLDLNDSFLYGFWFMSPHNFILFSFSSFFSINYGNIWSSCLKKRAKVHYQEQDHWLGLLHQE